MGQPADLIARRDACCRGCPSAAPNRAPARPVAAAAARSACPRPLPRPLRRRYLERALPPPERPFAPSGRAADQLTCFQRRRPQLTRPRGRGPRAVIQSFKCASGRCSALRRRVWQVRRQLRRVLRCSCSCSLPSAFASYGARDLRRLWRNSRTNSTPAPLVVVVGDAFAAGPQFDFASNFPLCLLCLLLLLLLSYLMCSLYIPSMKNEHEGENLGAKKCLVK